MKRFKVIDPATGADVFGGPMSESDLTIVYPMSNLEGETPLSDLGIHESSLHETAVPARGRGVYKIVRLEDSK